MSMKNQIPDKALLKNVMEQFISKGVSAVRLKASVSDGTATIEGIIEHDHQRRSIISVANSVAGVKNVIDLLQVGTIKGN